MPITSVIKVNSGSVIISAIIRGATSLRIGSVPSARIASICSDTTIEPSSAEIAETTRPVTINARQHRTQFAHQRNRNQISKLIDRAVRRQCLISLQRQHAAGEKPGKNNDRQRADADVIHLRDRSRGYSAACRRFQRAARAASNDISCSSNRKRATMFIRDSTIQKAARLLRLLPTGGASRAGQWSHEWRYEILANRAASELSTERLIMRGTNGLRQGIIEVPRARGMYRNRSTQLDNVH